MKKRYRFLQLLGLLLVATYAAFPLWSPILIRAQLPPGWQLLEAGVGYPGLKSVRIRGLQLATSFAGSGLTVTAGPGEVFYSGRNIQISSLSVAATRGAPAADGTPFSLQEFSLPLLVWPGTMPEISISEFDIDLASALPVLQFQNLEAGSGEDGSIEISAMFTAHDLESVSGRILGNLYPGSLEAGIWLTGATDNPLLEVTLSQQAIIDSAGSAITATAYLGAPEFPLLTAALFPDGPHLPRGLSGDLKVKARFGGSRQLLREVHLASPGLELQLENESFFTAFGVAAELAGGHVQLSSILPGNVRYEGKTSRLANLAIELIPQFKSSASIPADAVRQAELTIGQGSRLEFELDNWRQASFAGAANVAASTPAIEVGSMAFSQLQFRSSNLENLELEQLSGEMKLSVAAKKPFSYSLDDTTLRADSLSMHGQGQLQLKGDEAYFESEEPLGAELENMVLEVLEEDGFLAITAGRFVLETTLISANGSVITSGSGMINAGRIDSMGVNAELVYLQWEDLDLDKQVGNFQVRTEGLNLTMDTESYGGMNPEIGCGISSDGELGCRGSLLFGQGTSLPIGFTGDIDDGKWRLEFLPAQFNATKLRAVLNAAKLPIPDLIKINTGTIALHGAATLDTELRGVVDVEGDSIGFSVKKSEASNLSFTLSGELGDEVSATGSIALESATLAAGLDIDDIGAGIEVSGENSVAVNLLTAKLFGGTMQAQRLHFLDGVLQDSLVRISGSDLAEILTFVDIDGISGTGSIEILLPLGSDSKGLFIRDGSFNSGGPGILRYEAADPAMLKDNIGLQALDNFHYTRLDGVINYSSIGEYRIEVHLAGNNPALYDGYPIELNLNIAGELPEVFEVLFLTGDFEEAILERIRIK